MMHDIDIWLHPEMKDDGFCSSTELRHKDDDIEVKTGRARNLYVTRAIITVRIRSASVTVTGNEEECKEWDETPEAARTAFAYRMLLRAIGPAEFRQILKIVFQTGRAEGRNSLREDLQELIGGYDD